MLTNDDGRNSVGIQAMKAELLGRGHNLVLSAPPGEQSGSGAALTLDPLLITKEGDGQGAIEFPEALADGSRTAEPAARTRLTVCRPGAWRSASTTHRCHGKKF